MSAFPHLQTLAAHGPRLAIKAGFFALGLFLLLRVCLPAQQQAWALWIRDERLAHDTALGVVVGSALIVAATGFAFAAGQWGRGLFGLIAAAGLFSTSLLGLWNFYLYEGGRVLAQVEAVSATPASPSVDWEARRADRLAEIDRREAAALAAIDAELERTPEQQSFTRRTLIDRRERQLEAFRVERERIEARIAQDKADAEQSAAAPIVVARADADRRPVDAVLAGAGGERAEVASLLDLKRSALFELLLVLFAPLAFAAAPIARKPRGAGLGEALSGLAVARLAQLTARIEALTPKEKTPDASPAAQTGGAPRGDDAVGAADAPASPGSLPQDGGAAQLDAPVAAPPPAPPKLSRLKPLPPPTVEERARYPT